MRFLLLNQTFHPDVMATGQYLTTLAEGIVESGHEVTVITSRRAYDTPQKVFAKKEVWRGIHVIRVASTGFGKDAKWRRVADFCSFFLSALLRALFLKKHDAIVALTSPPLVCLIGAWLSRIWKVPFFYWVMDLNPDEAIAVGWLRKGSLAAKVLEAISLLCLRQAERIVVLDSFMRDRILTKGIPSERLLVVPPGPLDKEVKFDSKGREEFRRLHGLDGKFVVMYSGNHSPVHPLETLLNAAERLKGDTDIIFCFVGGGSEWRKIEAIAALNPKLSTNIRCLPYQPLANLSASLSAADLHVVVMGDAMLGLVHPCKIYNMLAVGAPVLYIGPEPSHVTEILDSLPSNYCLAKVRHGDFAGLVRLIQEAKSQPDTPHRTFPEVLKRCSNATMVSQMLKAIVSSSKRP